MYFTLIIKREKHGRICINIWKHNFRLHIFEVAFVEKSAIVF